MPSPTEPEPLACRKWRSHGLWFALRWGRENSDLEFPFGCPLNFLINVHFMQGIENGARGRHGVPYREHSFLSNPRLAPRLRSSRAAVRFSTERAAAPAEAGDVVTLPRGATDRELLAALGPGSAHDDTAVPPFEDSP